MLGRFLQIWNIKTPNENFESFILPVWATENHLLCFLTLNVFLCPVAVPQEIEYFYSTAKITPTRGISYSLQASFSNLSCRITVFNPSSFCFSLWFCISSTLKDSGHWTECKQEVDLEVWGLWGELEIMTTSSRGEMGRRLAASPKTTLLHLMDGFESEECQENNGFESWCTNETRDFPWFSFGRENARY